MSKFMKQCVFLNKWQKLEILKFKIRDALMWLEQEWYQWTSQAGQKNIPHSFSPTQRTVIEEGWEQERWPSLQNNISTGCPGSNSQHLKQICRFYVYIRVCISTNTYTSYAYIQTITITQKEAIILKESEEEYMGRFWREESERRNVVTKL